MHAVMTYRFINNRLAWLLDDHNPRLSRLEHHQTRIPSITTARRKALNGMPCRAPVVRSGNTAEPSGELQVGDLVAVGETALTVEQAGWAPLRGGITEVRIDEHGTHPPTPG